MEAQDKPSLAVTNSAAQAADITTALAEFIRYLKDERGASPLTLDAYERDLLRFVGELETTRDAAESEGIALASISAEDIRKHMHGLLDRRLSKATVRRALHALGSFFGWAVRWQLLPCNPVLRVTIPRRERVRHVRALSKRERAILIAAADKLATHTRGLQATFNIQAPLLIRLMLKTGLRRSELLALTWADVNLDRGEVLVRLGKGGKSRRVPIEDGDLLARLFATHAKLGPSAATKPVFINTRHKPFTHSAFYRLFHRVLDCATLAGTGITPHSLRHTFGSLLCERGVPVPYVKDLLGHEDISSTMVYVHSTPVELRRAVRKLGE